MLSRLLIETDSALSDGYLHLRGPLFEFPEYYGEAHVEPGLRYHPQFGSNGYTVSWNSSTLAWDDWSKAAVAGCLNGRLYMLPVVKYEYHNDMFGIAGKLPQRTYV
jgi:hypothetical protein